MLCLRVFTKSLKPFNFKLFKPFKRSLKGPLLKASRENLHQQNDHQRVMVEMAEMWDFKKRDLQFLHRWQTVAFGSALWTVSVWILSNGLPIVLPNAPACGGQWWKLEAFFHHFNVLRCGVQWWIFRYCPRSIATFLSDSACYLPGYNAKFLVKNY